MGLEALELFQNRSNGVFVGRIVGDVAAHKLVRIDVADEPTQSFEMLAPRARLIVLRDNVLQAFVRQELSPTDKTRIIETVVSESKLFLLKNEAGTSPP